MIKESTIQTIQQRVDEIAMSTLEELDAKMEKIASSYGMDVESFKKLPRKQFIAKCNEYNNKNK